jgi:uncharacterized protein (TIGR03435 family)
MPPKRLRGVEPAVLLLLGCCGAQAQPAARLEFEVASIKPGDPKVWNRAVGMPDPGRFVAKSASLKGLIVVAYGVLPHQIVDGPKWLDSDLFTIEAKPPAGSQPAPGPGGVGFPPWRLMLQSLLEDRFHLSFHRETREQQVYDLVLAKGGLKMKENSGPDKKGRLGLYANRVGQTTGVAVPMSTLVDRFSRELGHSVIDKTGLTGKYNYDLSYTPDPAQAAALYGPVLDVIRPADPDGPSLFTAIQEQLGLKLESTKGPVEVLVIDRAEKPSAN